MVDDWKDGMDMEGTSAKLTEMAASGTDGEYCGDPCGYYQLPLMREVVSYRATSGFDPHFGRHLGIMIGTSVLNFEDSGRLTLFFEAAQHFEMNEKPNPAEKGAPQYINEFFIGQPSPMYYPSSKGGVASYTIPAFDGRGGNPSELPGKTHSGGAQPGLAVGAYDVANLGIMRNVLAWYYYNLYPEDGTSGCGMPELGFFHNEHQFQAFDKPDANDRTQPVVMTKDAWGVDQLSCVSFEVCYDFTLDENGNKTYFTIEKYSSSREDKDKLIFDCDMKHRFGYDLIETTKNPEERKEFVEWIINDPNASPYWRDFAQSSYLNFRKSFQSGLANWENPLTKAISTSFSVLGTLDCAKNFVHTNRPDAHGMDVIELVVWLHQLTEYSYDLRLDRLVAMDFWNSPPAGHEPACSKDNSCNYPSN